MEKKLGGRVRLGRNEGVLSSGWGSWNQMWFSLVPSARKGRPTSPRVRPGCSLEVSGAPGPHHFPVPGPSGSCTPLALGLCQVPPLRPQFGGGKLRQRGRPVPSPCLNFKKPGGSLTVTLAPAGSRGRERCWYRCFLVQSKADS